MTDIYFEAFDNISYPIVLIDQAFRIRFANKAASQQFGLNRNDIVGRLCYDATHDRKEPCWVEKKVQCPVKQVIQGKERVKVIHKHNYRERYVLEEIVATPIRDPENGSSLIMEEFRDITELLGLDSNVLPVCCVCKNIRDLKGNWLSLEEHIFRQTGTDFSHSYCPDCYQKYSPKFKK